MVTRQMMHCQKMWPWKTTTSWHTCHKKL